MGWPTQCNAQYMSVTSYFVVTYDNSCSMIHLLILGVVLVPGAVVGNMVGSILIKKLQMDCKACLKGMFLTSSLVLALSGMYLITCDNALFDGVTINSETG